MNYSVLAVGLVVVISCLPRVCGDDVSDRLNALILACENIDRYAVGVRIESFNISEENVRARLAFGMLAARLDLKPIHRIDAIIPASANEEKFEEHVLESNDFRINYSTSNSRGALTGATIEYQNGIIPRVANNLVIRRLEPMYLPCSSCSIYLLERTKTSVVELKQGTVVGESESEQGVKTVWILNRNRKAGCIVRFGADPNWLPHSIRFVSGSIGDATSRADLLAAVKSMELYAETETEWEKVGENYLPRLVEMKYSDRRTDVEMGYRFFFANWRFDEEIDDRLFDRGDFVAHKLGKLVDMKSLVSFLEKNFSTYYSKKLVK